MGRVIAYVIRTFTFKTFIATVAAAVTVAVGGTVVAIFTHQSQNPSHISGPSQTPTRQPSPLPTNPTNGSGSPYVYVEALSLNPSPTGQGQAYMNSKAYEHSVWYDVRTTLSFDIPVAGKYQFLDVYIGQQDGITASATYDIKGDNETLVGVHGLGGGDKPEHLTIPITGRQVVTFDVVVYYGNAQTSRMVLGNARLLA